jgi:hypothetical protein
MLNKKWRLLGMGGIVIGKSEVEIENATLNVGCGPWLTPIGSISTRRKNFKREPRREPARIRGTTKSTDTFLSQPTLSYSSRLTHK